MPHQEYLQIVHYNVSFVPPDTNLVFFDIPMPLCGPRQICNIHAVETIHDASSTGIRWVLLLSMEPNDLFIKDNVHTQSSNDTFYKRVVWNLANTDLPEMNHTSYYAYPIAYPYEKLRMGLRQSSISTGSTWNIIIYYTIEPISAQQLTAITVRRGTVKHARAQGPEP